MAVVVVVLNGLSRTPTFDWFRWRWPNFDQPESDGLIPAMNLVYGGNNGHVVEQRGPANARLITY